MDLNISTSANQLVQKTSQVGILTKLNNENIVLSAEGLDQRLMDVDADIKVPGQDTKHHCSWSPASNKFIITFEDKK